MYGYRKEDVQMANVIIDEVSKGIIIEAFQTGTRVLVLNAPFNEVCVKKEFTIHPYPYIAEVHAHECVSAEAMIEKVADILYDTPIYGDPEGLTQRMIDDMIYDNE